MKYSSPASALCPICQKSLLTINELDFSILTYCLFFNLFTYKSKYVFTFSYPRLNDTLSLDFLLGS